MSTHHERILPSDLLAVAAGAAPFLLILPIIAAAGTYLFMARTPPSFRAQAVIQDTAEMPEGSAAALRPLSTVEGGSIISVEAQSPAVATTNLRAELARLDSELPEELTSAAAAISAQISIYQHLHDKILEGLEEDIQSRQSITESTDVIIRLNRLLRSLKEEKLLIEVTEKGSGDVAQNTEIRVERISASPVRASFMAAVAAVVVVYVLSFALWRWRIFAATPASMERFKSTRSASSLLGQFARKQAPQSPRRRS